MNNYKSSGPGGLRGRREFIGGRPKSDGEYGPKKKFDKKPFGGNRSGFGGGNRGGDRGRGRGSFGGGGRGGDRRDVEMHKAICSACGKSCEVPFRPDGSKPVLCSECFEKAKSDDRGGFENRDRSSGHRSQRDNDRIFNAPQKDRTPSPEMKALQQQFLSLENKLDEILLILTDPSPEKVKKEKEAAPPAEKVVSAKPDTKKKVAKKVTVKKTVTKKAVKKVAKKVAKKK